MICWIVVALEKPPIQEPKSPPRYSLTRGLVRRRPPCPPGRQLGKPSEMGPSLTGEMKTRPGLAECRVANSGGREGQPSTEHSPQSTCLFEFPNNSHRSFSPKTLLLKPVMASFWPSHVHTVKRNTGSY